MLVLLLFFVFFFQAEDGIRDVAVTEFRRVLFRSRSARADRGRRRARAAPRAPRDRGPNAARVSRGIEERPGFPGALRTSGGCGGAISGPPTSLDVLGGPRGAARGAGRSLHGGVFVARSFTSRVSSSSRIGLLM